MEDLASLIIIVILFVLPLVCLVWQPRWLKPTWLQWLEDNYGPVLEKMFQAARKMGPRQWEAQVRTQADLEHWAERVARKYKWK